MTQIEGYVPKKDRKKVLLICDDIRHFSGVATMAREIVINSAHRVNWVQIAGAMHHPENNKRLDISQSTSELLGIDDASVFLYPVNGYGDQNIVRAIVELEKPDAIMIFTDPRYFTWLFDMEHELRKNIPIIYYSIWDSAPAPLYNTSYYESCDSLLCISKQTENLTKLVLGNKAKDKLIKYIPHGIDHKSFYPINNFMKEQTEAVQNMRTKLFGKNQPEFVLFYNARNIRRKSVPDLIAAYKLFTDKLGKEKAKKCALLMHTQIIDDNGTDLKAVADLLLDESYQRVVFTEEIYTINDLNLLYNIADATCLISSNEGWGLSLTESLMTGTMIIANVTGGMQDQMRFEDEQGNWLNFNENFCSNHFGTYKKHAPWAVPVYPSNSSLVGSPATPYILDDRADFRHVADAMLEVYNMDAEERSERGLKARKWVTSQEAMMTSQNMASNIADSIYETLEKFKPRDSFEFIKAGIIPKKKLVHPLVY